MVWLRIQEKRSTAQVLKAVNALLPTMKMNITTPLATRKLEAGHIRVAPLIHAHYPLTEGIMAMEKAAQRGSLKVLLHMT
jgi:hypothetical protein